MMDVSAKHIAQIAFRRVKGSPERASAELEQVAAALPDDISYHHAGARALVYSMMHRAQTPLELLLRGLDEHHPMVRTTVAFTLWYRGDRRALAKLRESHDERLPGEDKLYVDVIDAIETQARRPLAFRKYDDLGVFEDLRALARHLQLPASERGVESCPRCRPLGDRLGERDGKPIVLDVESRRWSCPLCHHSGFNTSFAKYALFGRHPNEPRGELELLWRHHGHGVDWRSELRGSGVYLVAVAIAGKAVTAVPCPACCYEAIDVAGFGRRWHCASCDRYGDGADLAALHVAAKSADECTPDDYNAVGNWAARERLLPGGSRRQYRFIDEAQKLVTPEPLEVHGSVMSALRSYEAIKERFVQAARQEDDLADAINDGAADAEALDDKRAEVDALDAEAQSAAEALLTARLKAGWAGSRRLSEATFKTAARGGVLARPPSSLELRAPLRWVIFDAEEAATCLAAMAENDANAVA